jgi:hypothetical protein
VKLFSASSCGGPRRGEIVKSKRSTVVQRCWGLRNPTPDVVGRLREISVASRVAQSSGGLPKAADGRTMRHQGNRLEPAGEEAGGGHLRVG